MTEWVEADEPIYYGIPDLPPEPFTTDGPLALPEDQRPEVVYVCRGCKKEFNVPIARAGHERYCKALVKRRKPNAST